MNYMVSVNNSVVVKLDEEYYNQEFLNDVRGYWQGLDGYDDEEILEWLAEHIGTHIVKGYDISQIEGIHINENAHEIIAQSNNIEVEEIEIK